MKLPKGIKSYTVYENGLIHIALYSSKNGDDGIVDIELPREDLIVLRDFLNEILEPEESSSIFDELIKNTPPIPPVAPTLPDQFKNKGICQVCNMDMSEMTHYVCYNNRCPSRTIVTCETDK